MDSAVEKMFLEKFRHECELLASEFSYNTLEESWSEDIHGFLHGHFIHKVNRDDERQFTDSFVNGIVNYKEVWSKGELVSHKIVMKPSDQMELAKAIGIPKEEYFEALDGDVMLQKLSWD